MTVHRLRSATRRATAALVTATAALALASPAGAAVSTSTIATGGGDVLTTWVAANENTGTTTLTEALRVARTHDVVSARPGTYAPYLAPMRTANPSLRLFAYMNGSFAQKNQGTLYPEAWYLRDALGRKITSLGFGNYLMDPSSPGWRAERVQHCAKVLASSGYDGCMLDMLGVAPLDKGYVTGLPVNPATRTVWTAREWLAATDSLAAAVRAGTGKPVVGNGAASGARYFHAVAPTSVLNNGTDASVAEVWLRPASARIDAFPAESRWKASVDQLVDAGRSGENVLTMTKLWVPGTQAQKDRWHQYALASFLLGTDGRARFNLSYERTGDHTHGHAWWDVQLGAPVGAYAKTGSVYTRQFTGGTVLVNPTTARVVVPLPKPMRGLDGVVRTSVVLDGQQGAVLRTA